ncbi:MAG: hypothetical protein V1841_00180 [Patescibacteria group bacterium]
MLNFNLLPPEGKRELKMEEMNLQLGKLLRAIFWVWIFFIVLLGTIYLYLSIIVKAQKELILTNENNSRFQEFQKIEREISGTNLRINKLYGIQQKSVYFSPIVEELARIISSVDGVYLNSIEITPKTEVITLENPSLGETVTPSNQNGSSKEEEQTENPQVVQKDYLAGSISGFAKKRGEVLEMESALRASIYFKEVISPLENIISPEDINFVFDFKIK